MNTINFATQSSQPGLFVPAAKPGNPYFEIWRDGSKHEFREGNLADDDVEAWINESGPFEISSPEGNPCRDKIRLIFGRPRPASYPIPSGRIHSHGLTLPFNIPFKRATFTMLLDRCKLSRQILDLLENRAVGGQSSNFLVRDESGVLSIRSFLGLLRLQTNIALIAASSYNTITGTTTGIILQAEVDDVKAIKELILHHKACTGHELLLRTIMAGISVDACAGQVSEVKQHVMDIEASTGQHTWDNYRASSTKPQTDMELSRIAHGLRIQVAVLCRRIEVVSYWIERLTGTLEQEQSKTTSTILLLEWMHNMKAKTHIVKLDIDLVAKRAEIQVGAIYSRFAQRDNVTTQKISEATNRDSSAMKYLAVLGAIFLPPTFVATLFALDALRGQPLWVFWIVTIPLTFMVLAVWAYWANWRSRSVRRMERRLDEMDIV